MRSLRLMMVLTAMLLCSCRQETAHHSPNADPVDQSFDLESARSTRLHPSFTFNADNIAAEIPDLPGQALADPGEFLSLVLAMLDEEQWLLTLVDKEHPLARDFAPPGIVSLDTYPSIPVNRDGLELAAVAADALSKLCDAARDDGIHLPVSSAYRSWTYQENLFNRYADRDGDEAASRYSARPGESQHQLGTTVDFGDITNRFAETETGIWIHMNGGSFGWSLSYPAGGEEETGYMWESWHWRYIGIPAAEMQERFFDGGQQAMLEFWDRNREILEERRAK